MPHSGDEGRHPTDKPVLISRSSKLFDPPHWPDALEYLGPSLSVVGR